MTVLDRAVKSARRAFPAQGRIRVEEYIARRRPSPVAEFGIDPYEIQWVDPAQIDRISGRARPRAGGDASCGAVADGDWDIRPPAVTDDPMTAMVCAARFEETRHFESLAAHFIDGVRWEETDLIATLISRGGDPKWPAYKDLATIRDTCRKLDSLYEDVNRRGVVSQRELAVEDRSADGFLHIMRHEILVDIARDGSYLFFEGRHRLTIAKLVAVPLVPVAVATRHRDLPVLGAR